MIKGFPTEKAALSLVLVHLIEHCHNEVAESFRALQATIFLHYHVACTAIKHRNGVDCGCTRSFKTSALHHVIPLLFPASSHILDSL